MGDQDGHYEGKATHYAAGRAGYAPEALRLLMAYAPPGEGACIADMGAGTGIFSQGLLEAGYRVYGVEPSAAMGQKMTTRLGETDKFTWIAAGAEHTGLPEGSVDAVTAASAFHWFDRQAFRAECSRILKPGGRVFLLVNQRWDQQALSRDQCEVCRRFCPHFPGLHHGADETDSAAPHFFPQGYKKECYRYDLTYSAEQFLARCLSSSYSPGPDDEGYEGYRGALQDLIARHAIDGKIVARNDTVLWHGA